MQTPLGCFSGICFRNLTSLQSASYPLLISIQTLLTLTDFGEKAVILCPWLGRVLLSYLRPRAMSYPQAHPRFSVLSSSSLQSLDHLSPAASSTRFSLPSAPSINTTLTTPKPGIRPNIYDRNLNKTRTAEVSAAAFAFLFSEVVQYTQKRVSGIADLERRSVLYMATFRLLRLALQTEYARLSRGSPRLGAHVLEE